MKIGEAVIITRHDEDDYELCITEDLTDVNTGHSIRGTWYDISMELISYVIHRVVKQ